VRKPTPAGEALSAAELEQLGERFGRGLAPGDVIHLEGELGVGKTTFAQAICRGYGARRLATSPTFALVHRYAADRGVVYHVDCYRLRSHDEARDLDFEGMRREGALLLVEWPERAGGWAPPPTHRVRLFHVDSPDHRLVDLA